MSNSAELNHEVANLSQKITELVSDFETATHHCVEVKSIQIERMRLIGPRKALCTVQIYDSNTDNRQVEFDFT